jgi:hypothetical protein
MVVIELEREGKPLTLIRAYISTQTAGGPDMYLTQQINRIWSHKWQFSIPWVSQEGVKVQTYHISPALRSFEGSSINSVGVVAHEYVRQLTSTNVLWQPEDISTAKRKYLYPIPNDLSYIDGAPFEWYGGQKDNLKDIRLYLSQGWTFHGPSGSIRHRLQWQWLRSVCDYE